MRVTKLVDIDNEEWRDIKGYEGLYQVSNLGRVKKLKGVIVRKNGHTLPSKECIRVGFINQGYEMVTLSKNDKKKCHRVHRLVATAFIPNPEEFPIINHKDENKLNNRVENLEWCTYSYNNTYGDLIQRKNATKKERHIFCKPVQQYGLDGVFLKEYSSITEASESLKLNGSWISICCNKYKGAYTCGGFQWKFKSSNRIITDIRNYIYQFDKNYNFINKFLSVHNASIPTGVSNTAIHNCLSQRCKTAGGFVWCRKN